MKLAIIVETESPSATIPEKVLKKYLTKNIKKLVAIFEQYGYEIRIVGGAVRDMLLGLKPRDIDFSTNASPLESMYILRKENIEYSSKGIEHGTIKAKFSDDEEYEITALDFSMEEKGGSIQTTFHRSWLNDARKRDFTINSMSMDLEGNVYDYNHSMKDLKSEKIVIIGNPEERVREFPKLIIRFFKALTVFKHPKYSDRLIDAIRTNRKLVKKLEPEWVKKMVDGFMKDGHHPERAKKLMERAGVYKIAKEVMSKAKDEARNALGNDISNAPFSHSASYDGDESMV